MKKQSNLELKVKFEAKTENQKDYIRSIAENDITMVYGPAGSGKTYLAAGMAAQYYSQGRVENIVLTRPMVQTGRGLGYLKGDLKEKYEPYLLPLLEQLEKFCGKSNYLVENGIVRMMPLELMRGMNFDKSFMILDEAENADYEQIKMFLTRIGNGSKIVLCGDDKQTDLHKCDYSEVLSKLQNIEGVGICKLTTSDIQRNGIIGRILSRLEN